MNYDTKNMRAALWAADTCRAFADWLATEGDQLASAAMLLGGATWERRAEAVATAIRQGASPDDVETELAAMHRLLTLQYTDDLDSIEAIQFMSVHPDDPRADDARLCAESLERGLEAIRILATTAVREVA